MKKFRPYLILSGMLIALTSCSTNSGGVGYYKGQLLQSSWDSQAKLMECSYRVIGANAFGTFSGYLPRGQTLCPRYAKMYTDNTMDFIYPQ
ncbi:hypothetical protein [Avibacterium paragallinarum]|uniref:hypothetical protein n=1 Tax=Avibacterium TaxID=292486 RepID=UPI003977FBF9